MDVLYPLAPCDQVNALFSEFYEQERDETVRLDSLRILLQSLRLIGCYLFMDKLMLSWKCYLVLSNLLT